MSSIHADAKCRVAGASGSSPLEAPPSGPPAIDFDAVVHVLGKKPLAALEDLVDLQADDIDRAHAAGVRVAIVTVEGVAARELGVAVELARKHLPDGAAVAARIAALAADGELVLVLLGIVGDRFEVGLVTVNASKRFAARLLAPFPASGGNA